MRLHKYTIGVSVAQTTSQQCYSMEKEHVRIEMESLEHLSS